MVLAAGVPVIPVAVANTAPVRTALGIPWIWQPRVVIGKPRDFTAYAALADDRDTLRWITDEVMFDIQQLSGQTYVDGYGTSVKSGSLTPADVEARVLPRPGYGSTPPRVSSSGLS